MVLLVHQLHRLLFAPSRLKISPRDDRGILKREDLRVGEIFLVQHDVNGVADSKPQRDGSLVLEIVFLDEGLIEVDVLEHMLVVDSDFVVGGEEFPVSCFEGSVDFCGQGIGDDAHRGFLLRFTGTRLLPALL